MSDVDFTPASAIPAPDSSLPVTAPPRSRAVWPLRVAFAVFVPLGLYAEAGSGYFTTACRPLDLATNFNWGLFILIVLPVVMLIPFAVSYLAVAGGTLAIPRGARAVRLRNRLALGLAVVVPVVALIAGAIFPTRCTLF